MLYLVKLDSTYKIGFSKDPIKRIKQFETSHVDVELISTKFGNMNDERQLHLLCSNYHIKNELFKQDDNVIKIFNTYISTQLQNDINSKLKELDKYDYYKELNILQDKAIKSQSKMIDILFKKLANEYNDLEALNYLESKTI